ncbi:hypothetical protein BDQ17DRAFT_1330847 [Cyathus striatus]|nr:hypothetical protein BDQ17DRAFT_1330847 [Cyathus striatus]
MVMNWYIVTDTCYGSSMVAPDDPSDIPDATLCTPVNITYDTNLLRLNGDDWDKKLDNQDPSVPIFTWDPLAQYNSFYSKLPVFRTTSSLFSKSQLTSDKGPRDGSLQNYPLIPHIQHWYRRWVYGNVRQPIYERFHYRCYHVLAQCLVKAYVFIIVIGVWIITLIFVGSVSKVIFGYQQPIEAFVIPIGTLFAITSLRGSMPGAPNGFGAIIDFVGILPCLAIITLTGVFLFAFLVIAKNIEGVMEENEAAHRAQEKLNETSSI